jgi:hypothetical protein
LDTPYGGPIEPVEEATMALKFELAALTVRESGRGGPARRARRDDPGPAAGLPGCARRLADQAGRLEVADERLFALQRE